MTTYLPDEIRLGWYLVELIPERYMRMKGGYEAWRQVRPHFLRDRKFVTAAAFIPCPFNEWGPTERPRLPMVEIDGVIQEHALEAFHRIARWPIERTEWMRRRGYA